MANQGGFMGEPGDFQSGQGMFPADITPGVMAGIKGMMRKKVKLQRANMAMELMKKGQQVEMLQQMGAKSKEMDAARKEMIKRMFEEPKNGSTAAK